MHSTTSKIIHVTTAHPRDDVRIKAKFANSWAALGSAELVVCDGLPDETIDGVEIHGLTKRKGRLSRMLLGPLDCLRYLHKRKDYCILHLHDPELLLTAMFMRWAGYTVIFDLHEDLIDQVISKPYLPRRVAALAHIAPKIIYPLLLRSANAHIAATEAISHSYSGRLKKPVLVVHNYVMQMETREPESYAPASNALVYSGAINEIRGILRMLTISEQLPDGWTLILCGRFRTDALKHKSMQHPGWKNIRYRGHVSRDEVQQIYSQAACGLILFDKQPNHMESLPNKLFEYMGNALPCITTDIEFWKGLVEGNGVGICVTSEDDDAMLKKINAYLDDPELRSTHAFCGARLVREQYTWEPQFNKYVAFIRKLQGSAG